MGGSVMCEIGGEINLPPQFVEVGYPKGCFAKADSLRQSEGLPRTEQAAEAHKRQANICPAKEIRWQVVS